MKMLHLYFSYKKKNKQDITGIDIFIKKKDYAWGVGWPRALEHRFCILVLKTMLEWGTQVQAKLEAE